MWKRLQKKACRETEKTGTKKRVKNKKKKVSKRRLSGGCCQSCRKSSGTSINIPSGRHIKKKNIRKGTQTGRGDEITRAKVKFGESTNIELEKMLTSSKSFKGVFSHDTMPKLKNENSSGIINLHTSEKNGSHWVCWYHKKNEPFIEYMDSFGVVPSSVIEKNLKKVKKKVLYNTTQIQDNKSKNCGIFCYYYIKSRDKGISPLNTLLKFNVNPKNNDKILEKLVKSGI